MGQGSCLLVRKQKWTCSMGPTRVSYRTTRQQHTSRQQHGPGVQDPDIGHHTEHTNKHTLFKSPTSAHYNVAELVGGTVCPWTISTVCYLNNVTDCRRMGERVCIRIYDEVSCKKVSLPDAELHCDGTKGLMTQGTVTCGTVLSVLQNQRTWQLASHFLLKYSPAFNKYLFQLVVLLTNVEPCLAFEKICFG